MLTWMSLLLLGKMQAQNPTYSVPRLSGVTIKGLPSVTSHICVDQFGYLPDSEKVAVINDPQKGYNAWDHYKPGPKMVLRRRSDGVVVFSSAPVAWKEGATHEDSGDRGWWFDFSCFKTPGEYYVFDPYTGQRSPVFMIGEAVFSPILKAATRMFYYQRLNEPIATPYAEKPWTEGAGLPQDARTRNVLAKDDSSQERDMSGGWMDAGDTNKYPTFNGDVIHPLLYAYRANPKAFGDANGIPESGNGRPDLLDETKIQLDWMVKMQFPDGSVPIKMGNIDYSGTYPLSKDKRTRYYGPKDSGAAIYSAACYAHAARVYGEFPAWRNYAADLRARAIKSWNWFKSNPRTTKSDTGEIKSGIANRSNEEQDRMEAFAAVHLFALTGEAKYHEAFKAKYQTARQIAEYLWSPYEAGASEALVDYLSLPKADPAISAKIRKQLAQSATSQDWAPPAAADLYRAWMVPTSYHWGSNFVRAGYGFTALLAAKHGELDASTQARLRSRAADILHSFHGVNPFGAVYLSNMKSYGAELSMMAIYHERYGVSSPFTGNPPPGYVVGGPNQSVTGKAADGAPSVEWLKKQPRAKTYADFNKAWPESSWELSEPANYYQAMYIRLLAEFSK